MAKVSRQAEMIFPDIIVQRLHQMERELRQQQLSEESLSWLAMANLIPERLATQLDPLPSLPENVHIYHCDHLGTPLALLDRRGKIGWQVTRDPWGNIVRENNLEHLEQPICMQGQHYDSESGLYYNRHRYYDPWQGKYITQDPIGLRGGTNSYRYPNNSIQFVDPLGLNTMVLGAGAGAAVGGPPGALVGAIIGGVVLVGIGFAAWLNSTYIDRTDPEALTEAHRKAAAAGNRTSAAGYGGNCTPDEHDQLKQEQDNACNQAKGLTCPDGQPDFGKVEKLEACRNARINIARRCFAGGDKGHNRQIEQIQKTIGNCMGHKTRSGLMQ